METESKRKINSLPNLELDYLLNELELLVHKENEQRNRAEQLLQIFLTVLTAIIGAMLIILQASKSFIFTLLTFFWGTITILSFSTFSLIRICSFRQNIADIALRLFLVRKQIYTLGIKCADKIFPLTLDKKTGFMPTTISILMYFAGFCGLIFTFLIILTIIILLYLLGYNSFECNICYYLVYGISSIIGFFSSFLFLRKKITKYKLQSYAQMNNFDQK